MKKVLRGIAVVPLAAAALMGGGAAPADAHMCDQGGVLVVDSGCTQGTETNSWYCTVWLHFEVFIDRTSCIRTDK